MTKYLKVYYYFTNKLIMNEEAGQGNWGLTTYEDQALELDINYRMATLEDLDDLFCASGVKFKGEIEVVEGVCQWVDISDVQGGYLLSSKQDV